MARRIYNVEYITEDNEYKTINVIALNILQAEDIVQVDLNVGTPTGNTHPIIQKRKIKNASTS